MSDFWTTQVIEVLVILCGFFLLLWRIEVQESRYWKREVMRYREQWDRATWQRDFSPSE
jgi:DNA-binding helix-hairpin-helix protein with protein kinase domain